MPFSHYFPRKKMPVLLVAVIAVLIIGGVILWQGEEPSDGTNGVGNQVAGAQETSPALELDRAEDGLKNWEEALWGTDPDNPDTDGDRTNDRDEIQADRDPTAPGPNDTLHTNGEKDGTNSTSTAVAYANLNTPEKAMRDFVSRLLALQASGELDSGSQERISNLYIVEALKGFDPEKELKSYTKNDIIVSQTSGNDALKKYGNAMGTILKRFPSPNSGKTELYFFMKARATDNKALLQEIPPYVERYKNIINASLAVPVPKEAISIHLGFVNAFSALAFDAEAMAEGDTQPVISQAKIAWYTNNKERGVFQALENITNFFNAHRIVYRSNEPGSVFSNFFVRSE